MPRDPERTYTELLFHSSRKYASWDPEVPVRVGDWGVITRGTRSPWYAFWAYGRRQGIFLKHGNIYEDGRAADFAIPPPKTHEHQGSTGISWVVSQNAVKVGTTGDASAQTPSSINCRAQASFKFSAGRGAVLCMDGDTITTIDPPGALRPLLDDTSLPEGVVVVSEVHATSSYARYLGTSAERQVSIGLRATAPALPDVGGADVGAEWLISSTAGNFKSKINPDGARTYYPLFRLVALDGAHVSNGPVLLLSDESALRRGNRTGNGPFRCKSRPTTESPESENHTVSGSIINGESPS
ncbi:unnamed protein product [Peniophora sp. CBMAI 1063]|nr:unnamed protein product [Peniophora sp. CBMAI 1063]